MSTPVLLDCDPGHDDAIALLLALGSPELELLGVTTVAGNQTVEKTTANAIRVLELAGVDVPVAAGADRPLGREPCVAAYVHGETGLDGPDLPPPRAEPVGQHAVDFLAEQIAGVTLIATGPLTNIALLLAGHPGARPERLVLMGGAIAEGDVTPAAEFNIWADPEAAARVFASGLDITMVGLDVTHKALLSDSHAAKLRENGRVGGVVADLLDFYAVFHKQVYDFDGSPIHDAVAVAQVIRPDLIELRRLNVEIECESTLCRGRTVVDVWGRTAREPNANVALGVFLSTVIYLGWSGGFVGGLAADALDALIGAARAIFPLACLIVGALILARSELVDMRPFRTGLAVFTAGLMLTLGKSHGGYLGTVLAKGFGVALGGTGVLIVGVTTLLAGSLLLTGASAGAIIPPSGPAVPATAGAARRARTATMPDLRLVEPVHEAKPGPLPPPIDAVNEFPDVVEPDPPGP